MFYNYFKTAFRNLLRNKGYATINIVGLAVGIAACLLIFLVIQFETSFDDFHKKKNNIYRVGGTQLYHEICISNIIGSTFPVVRQVRIGFSRRSFMQDQKFQIPAYA
jgi:putative ABC transport system permease protein